MIYLVEFTTGATAWRFANGNGFVSTPTDTPANAVYPARVVNPGAYERHLWAPGGTSGRGAVAVGVVELANADGALDALLASDVDGCALTVLAAPEGTATRAGFSVAFIGTIQSVSGTAAVLQINLADRMATVAALPMVTARYGGTNVLPAGVDGTPADIMGQAKPLVLGECENFTPPCVNTSALIYQVSSRAIAALVSVWTAGAVVTAGVARVDAAALLAGTPAAGTFDYVLGDPTGGTEMAINGAFIANPLSASQNTVLNNWQWSKFGGTGVVTWDGVGAVSVAGDGAHWAQVTQQITTSPGYTYTVMATQGGAGGAIMVGTNAALDTSMLNTGLVTGSASYRFVASGTTAFIKFGKLSSGAPMTIGAISVKTGEGAYFRLGSSPGSQVVTAYAQEGANAAARTVAQCCMRAMQIAGLSSGDVAGLAAFDAQQSAVVGFYVDTNGATVGDVLDALCASAGAAWTPTRAGTWQLQRLADPAGGASAASFAPWQLLTTSGDPMVILPPDDNGGVPSYEIDLAYCRNWSVLAPSAIAGSVAVDRQTWLGLEYRQTVASAPAVWNPATRTGRNPLSKPFTATTLLRTQADAAAEAARLSALYSARRVYLSFSVAPSYAAGVDLGSVVTLTAPRFGFDAGRKLAVVGMREDYGANTTELFCWG